MPDEIEIYRKNLQKLKEQAALYGMAPPLSLINEIEWHEGKIEELETSLENVKNGHKDTVVILGQSTYESITLKISSLGYIYQNRLLRSSPENWKKIKQLLTELRSARTLVAVIVYLSEETILSTCTSDYQELWEELIAEFQKTKTLICIYEDNLYGKFSMLVDLNERLSRYEKDIFPKISENVATETKADILAQREELLFKISQAKILINTICNSELELAAYKRRADLVLRVHYFLDEIDRGVFLQIYVPLGRYQADQFKNLLGVFESYLKSVEKRSFSIDTRRTEFGVTYIFKSNDKISDFQEIDDAITRFNDFMDLCQNDPGKAEEYLIKLGIPRVHINSLIAKYTKSYQRIQMDIKHERNQKMLFLQQQLESEIFEFVNDRFLTILEINELPQMFDPTTSFRSNKLQDNTSHTIMGYRENILLDYEINGQIAYSEEDELIIEFLEKYLERHEFTTLKSELDQLKDFSSPVDVRNNAKQRLISFLYRKMPVLGEDIVKRLVIYLKELQRQDF